MSKSSGFDVSGLGDFVKRHGAQVATTALSYKMGGKIGKVLAAGQAADLAHKYQQEQKYKSQSNSGGHSDYNSGGQSNYNSGGQSNYNSGGQSNYNSGGQYGGGGQSSSHKSGSSGLNLDSIVSTGKDLFRKAETTIRGKTDGHGGQGGHASGPAAGAAFGAAAGSAYGSGYSSAPPEILQYLVNGAVIELTSNTTGRLLEIVSSFADSSLVFDANGNSSGGQSYNTAFTVVRVDNYTIMLHNNYNYVALNNGRLMVYPAGAGGMGIGDCRLTVYEPQRGIVALADGAGQAVAVGIDGLPLMANYSQSEALFAIRFLHTPSSAY